MDKLFIDGTELKFDAETLEASQELGSDGSIAMYDAVDRKKLRDLVKICSRARIGCMCAAGGAAVLAALLPVLAQNVTAWTVWAAMSLEALAFIVYRMGEYVKSILNKSWRF